MSPIPQITEKTLRNMAQHAATHTQHTNILAWFKSMKLLPMMSVPAFATIIAAIIVINHHPAPEVDMNLIFLELDMMALEDLL